MLTIAQYKEKFPQEYCKYSNCPYGELLISEGYLQFTQETAYNWAGPFEGNYAFFTLKDYTDAIQSYGVNKGKKYLDVLAAAEKAREDQTERNFYHRKPVIKHPEDPSWEFPIKLRMTGNDDTSYSKCYHTKEKALEELNLFIATQPLDFFQIVDDFNFIFTN